MTVDRWIIAGLIVAVGVLLYLHFSETRALTSRADTSSIFGSYENERINCLRSQIRGERSINHDC